MRRLPLFAALLAAAIPAVAAERAPHAFSGSIERLDPVFDQLVAPDAKLEVLARGFTWSEGPVWIDGTVLFSDVPQNVVYRWRPGASSAEVFLRPSGQLTSAPGFREPGSNGLGRDREGRLLLCQHGERRIARYDHGRFTSVADRYQGKRFNSPNDLAIRRNGDVYFTDPPYGLEGVEKSPLRELPFAGVYRATPGGEVTLLVKDLSFPNGIAFSPDESRLYVGVSESGATRIMAYDVQPDGGVSNGRVFYDAQPRAAAGQPGSCDGLKVDRDGNVWSTGPGGVLVLSATGRLLGVLHTGEPTANCGWGEDGGTLFITANMFLLRVRTRTRGAGW